MSKPIYTYATKNKDRKFYGINYNAYGILTFKSESDAERHAKNTISRSNAEDLEFIVLNITALVENGFISKEQLNEIWR